MIDPKIQSEQDREQDKATISVKLIENAVLVRTGPKWFSFPDWATASHHIGARIEAMKKRYAAGAPS